MGGMLGVRIRQVIRAENSRRPRTRRRTVAQAVSAGRKGAGLGGIWAAIVTSLAITASRVFGGVTRPQIPKTMPVIGPAMLAVYGTGEVEPASWASVPAPTFDSRCNALQIKCRRLRNTSKPMIL
ncbi:MAG: hypothetical protein CTY20_12630, partial [Hyphomicrobium sp.]